MIFIQVDEDQLNVIKDALHVAARQARCSSNFYQDMLYDNPCTDSICQEQCKKFAHEWFEQASKYQKVLNLLVSKK